MVVVKKYVLNFSFIAEIMIEEYIFINHFHLNTVTFKIGTLQSLLTFFYYLNKNLSLTFQSFKIVVKQTLVFSLLQTQIVFLDGRL
jgi:hypothetical protein